jgi:hypothetical protein|tara:strand:- start:45 stop:221 length:177 start_codon:yes stop_codon:yes gene_type:complete
MSISYKHRNNTYGGVTHKDILLKVDGVETTAIPIDEANRHYQDYLAWVAEGNTTEAAD